MMNLDPALAAALAGLFVSVGIHIATLRAFNRRFEELRHARKGDLAVMKAHEQELNRMDRRWVWLQQSLWRVAEERGVQLPPIPEGD